MHLSQAFNMRTLRSFSWLLGGALCLFGSGAVLPAAEPNKQDPAAPMSAHGTIPEAKAIAEQAYQLIAEAQRVLDQAQAAIAAGTPERIPAKPLGLASIKAVQAERLGLRLQELGEPAGVDVVLRYNKLYREMKAAATTYRGTRPGIKFLQSLRVQVLRSEPARLRQAQQIAEQAAKDMPAAERTLHAVLDDIQPAGLFTPTSGEQSIYAAFTPTRQLIDGPMARARRQETAQHCSERFTESLTKSTLWLEEARAAVATMPQGGPLTWDGEPLVGPAAIARFDQRWAAAHAMVIQASTLRMIHRSRGADGYHGGSDSKGAGNPLQPAIDVERRMLDEASTWIAEWLLADVVAADASELRQRYPQYLLALAATQRQTVDQTLRKACAGALDRMVVKAERKAEVETYRRATDELLRWRARLAAQQDQSLRSTSASLPELTRLAFQDSAGYTGLFPDPNASRGLSPGGPRLRAAAPDTLQPALPRLIGQAVVARNVQRLSPGSRTMIAALEDHTYGNLVAPTELEPAIDSLRRDLLLDSEHLPLTLDAAAAIRSAEQGEFQSVGGQVSNVHLEGLVTRLRTLPPVASILTPRGSLPGTSQPDTSQHGYLDQVLLRYDIVPSWVRHEYFVATIPSNK